MSLDAILAYMAQLLQSLSNYAAGLVNTALGALQSFINNLVASLTSALNAIVNVMQNLLVTLSTLMNQLLTTIQNAYNAIVNAILNTVQGFITKFSQFLDYVTAWVVALIRSAMDYIASVAKSIIDTIAGFVRDVITRVQDAISQMVGFAKEFFDSIANKALELWETIVARIKESYEKLLTGADAIINTVNERIGGLREAFEKSAMELVEAITGVAEEQLGPIREAISSTVDTWAGTISKEEMNKATKAFMTITAGHSLNLTSREQAQEFFSSNMPASVVSRFCFMFLVQLMTVIGVFGGVVNANAKVILQEFSEVYSSELLSPPDTIAVFRRGLINEDAAVKNIHKQGYTELDAVNMIRASSSVPAPGDVFALWHRGIINQKQVELALKAQGFTEDWIDPLTKGSFIHPPASDLITMAVRDVFSPATVDRFQQMEGFPEDFKREAAKAGLDEKWARNYWAAHWRLPSAEQGFEMFQRGVIQEEDLNLLLKSLDIMPFWREKMTKISYNTLTRVDVRRMHKIGVMSDGELPEAYENIGYSPEDALHLSEFTIELNKAKDSEGDEELGKLTKATILNFYEDGAITETRAIELLVASGYTSDAAQLLTNDVELKIELKARREAVDHIIEMVKAGQITADSAGDKLAALNLEPGEMRKAETRLLRAGEKKHSIPSRTEGEKMVTARIIGIGEYRELLALHGYAPKWVEAFVKLLGVKGGATEA